MTHGKCHGCQTMVPIQYCAMCDHWFCDRCRGHWLDRAGALFTQIVWGRRGDCCGPHVMPLAHLKVGEPLHG